MTRPRVTRTGEGGYRLSWPGGAPVTSANRFLRSVELRGLSPMTVRAYAYDLAGLYRWLEDRDEHSVESLTAKQFVEYVAAQRLEGAHPRSINRRLSTARLFYRFVTGEEMPSAGGASLPAAHYRGAGRDRVLGLHRLRKRRHNRLAVKVPRTVVEPLSRAQVRAFLDTLHRFRDLAIVYLMLLAGLRSQEVLLLEKRDVDVDEARMRVRGKGDKERVLPVAEILVDTLCRYLVLERPKSSETERLVPIDDAVVAMIGALQELGEEARTWLLETDTGSQALHVQFSQELARAAAGLAPAERITPHRLRHTYATELLCAGMSLVSVMKLLGHRDYRMTLRYAEITLEAVEEEYTAALSTLETRYRVTLSNPPQRAETFDPDRALEDLMAWLRHHTAPDRKSQRKARTLIRRLERIQARIAKLDRKQLPDRNAGKLTRELT